MRDSRKILVTGGAGFIGSNLTEKLLSDNYKVLCIDNFNDYYSPKIKENNIKKFIHNKNFELYTCDIRDRKKLFNIFKGKKIDKTIHLAAQAGVRYSFKNPAAYFDININGTINILDLAKEKKVKSFIFGSSSSVYGVSKIPFSEKGNLKPISPYGFSKKAGESICEMYSKLYKLPITILRFFTVYGPNQRPDMGIYKFTKLINENKEIMLYGNGNTKRDYTYISDIIDGIISALNKEFDFEIFNLGNSNPISLSNLISLIKKNLDKKVKIKYLPEQKGDPPITFADITKSKKLINYTPQVSIGEGIKKFVEWYKNEKS